MPYSSTNDHMDWFASTDCAVKVLFTYLTDNVRLHVLPVKLAIPMKSSAVTAPLAHKGALCLYTMRLEIRPRRISFATSPRNVVFGASL
jgi:hypothetical protein